MIMMPRQLQVRHNILVLLHYHNNPKWLQASYQSLKEANQHHENWRVAILDTAQTEPAEDVLAEEVKDLPGKTTFYTNKLTDFQSLITGGTLGMCLNRMIVDNHDANIITYLEDGNILHPKLLSNLDWYFNIRNNKLTCYFHVCPFNADDEFEIPAVPRKDYYLNKYKSDINPTGVIELGQLAWKAEVHWQFKTWFAWPTLKGPVHDFMQHLYYRTGSCPYSGFVGYFKTETKRDINPIERDVINCKMARAKGFSNRGENLQARLEFADVLKLDPHNDEARVLMEVADRQLGVRSIISSSDCRA